MPLVVYAHCFYALHVTFVIKSDQNCRCCEAADPRQDVRGSLSASLCWPACARRRTRPPCLKSRPTFDAAAYCYLEWLRPSKPPCNTLQIAFWYFWRTKVQKRTVCKGQSPLSLLFFYKGTKSPIPFIFLYLFCQRYRLGGSLFPDRFLQGTGQGCQGRAAAGPQA